MTTRRLYVVVAAAFVSLTGAGAVRWRAAVPPVGHETTSIDVTTASLADSLDVVLSESEDLIVSNDPFRLANVPASVRFDPDAETRGAGPVTAVAPPVRPTMTLKAIVGGPPWQAIVDGIPGQPQGTLVRAGSAFDKLVAQSVTRDSVVMRGPDTTWVLSFRRRQ